MPIRTSSLRSLGAFLNVNSPSSRSWTSWPRQASGRAGWLSAWPMPSDPRARRVIEEVARFSGWAARPAWDGVGLGWASPVTKARPGTARRWLEVEADTSIQLRKLWLAVDVGRVINPDGLINQIEGGAVQSAGWALQERVRFDRTKITRRELEQLSDPAVQCGARGGGPPGRRPPASRRQGPAALKVPRARSQGAIGTPWLTQSACGLGDLPLTTEQVTRAIEES